MASYKKTIKKIAIGLVCVAGFYLLVLLIAGVYINSRKAAILQYINTELKVRVRGTATIRDLDVSVWKYFPAIGFRVEGFTISDSVYHQPLLTVQTLATTFSLFKLITSRKTINNIFIEGGTLHFFTDSSGYSNSYLLRFKEKETAGKDENEQQSVQINDLQIENLDIIAEDKRQHKKIAFLVNRLKASISQSGQLMNIGLYEKVAMQKGLGFNLAKGAYLENQLLEANWKLQFNGVTKILSFGKTNVRINNHPFELSGHFVFSKTDPTFSIHINVKDLPFANAKAILTDNIRKKVELVQLDGPLDVNGSITGSLLPNREPAVDISWKTNNNTLTSSVARFSKCNFAGNFMNSVNKDSAHGDSNSRISIPSFKGDWDGINLEGKDIAITNLEQPQIHFTLHSDCRLEALDNKFALNNIIFKSGNANLDLFYDGPLTADNSMMQNLEGRLFVRSGAIDYVPKNFSFTRCNGDIEFYKDSISMHQFSCEFLKNKLDIRVEGNNIRRKFVVGDTTQDAIINCYVRSPYLDLEDFQRLFGEKKTRTSVKKPAESFAATARKLDNILDNSVIGVDIKAATIKRHNLEAKNLDAYIKFEPHHWKLAKVSFNLANGTVLANGRVTQGAHNTHDAMVDLKVDNADIKKILYAFDNFDQDAVTYKNIQGSFSTTASLSLGIDGLGRMIPSSLRGSVNFSLKNGALQNFSALENLKLFVFKNRNMSDVRFAEIKDRIDVKGNDLYLNRMEIQSSAFRLFLEGNYSLNNKNTDLLIQVPFSNLNDKSFSDSTLPKNKGIKKNKEAAMFLRAVNDDNGKTKIKFTLSSKVNGKSTATAKKDKKQVKEKN